MSAYLFFASDMPLKMLDNTEAELISIEELETIPSNISYIPQEHLWTK